MAKWYLKRSGKVHGPATEASIRKVLLERPLQPGDQVRQDEGKWRDATEAKKLFQSLMDNGWIVFVERKELGPYTAQKIIALHQEGVVLDATPVRQGRDKSWLKFHEVHARLVGGDKGLPASPQKPRCAAPSGADSKRWHSSTNGLVKGPLAFNDMKQWLGTERNLGQSHVYCQGGSWIEARLMKELIEQSNDKGWFIRGSDNVHGPFTSAHLLELIDKDPGILKKEARYASSSQWNLIADAEYKIRGLASLPDIGEVEHKGLAALSPQQADFLRARDAIKNQFLGGGSAEVDSTHIASQQLAITAMTQESTNEAIFNLVGSKSLSVTNASHIAINRPRRRFYQRLLVTLLLVTSCLGIMFFLADFQRHRTIRLRQSGKIDMVPSARASRLEERILDITRELEANPGDARSYYQRAITLQQLGKLEESLIDINVAIRLSPEVPEFYNDRGNIWLGLGWRERSIKDYSKSLDIDPGNSDALFNRGRGYRNIGESALAIRDLSKVVEADPEDIEARVELALAHTADGNVDNAIEHLSEVIRIEPANTQARVLRAQRLESKGDLENAIREYEAAVSISPLSGMANAGLKSALRSRERQVKTEGNTSASFTATISPGEKEERNATSAFACVAGVDERGNAFVAYLGRPAGAGYLWYKIPDQFLWRFANLTNKEDVSLPDGWRDWERFLNRVVNLDDFVNSQKGTLAYIRGTPKSFHVVGRTFLHRE